MTPHAAALFKAWHAAQGEKIKAARPLPIFAACVMAAKDLASRASVNERKIILTQDQITKCAHRALSQARLAEHGPPPRDLDAWWSQISAIAAKWGVSTRIEDWQAQEPPLQVESIPPVPRYSALEAAE